MRKASYKIIISALFTLFFLFACKVDKGTPAIEKDKMANILADIYQTQNTLDQNVILPKGAKKEYYYCNILERHEVTEDEFDRAVEWYASNLTEFDQVYVQTLAILEQRKQELEQNDPQ